MASCLSFGLGPAGSREDQPGHQVLSDESRPQAWLQGGTPAPPYRGDVTLNAKCISDLYNVAGACSTSESSLLAMFAPPLRLISRDTPKIACEYGPNEQLKGKEEIDAIRFPVTATPIKSEDDKQSPLLSQLYQDQIKGRALPEDIDGGEESFRIQDHGDGSISSETYDTEKDEKADDVKLPISELKHGQALDRNLRTWTMTGRTAELLSQMETLTNLLAPLSLVNILFTVAFFRKTR
ncbi:hypothetical protein CRENBAI_013077 [Crenichthys baileyi]|uniref:Uncharacterized protein n=1 Tax=Crenichthys baileyi TaxID=28760 RepID=A0AAV9QT55_9TELE